MLPFFRKHEDHFMGPSEHHAVGGEWRIEYPRVTWEITSHGEMCALRVIHDRFPDGSQVYDHVAGVGWMSILSNLKTLLETGEVMPIS